MTIFVKVAEFGSIFKPLPQKKAIKKFLDYKRNLVIFAETEFLSEFCTSVTLFTALFEKTNNYLNDKGRPSWRISSVFKSLRHLKLSEKKGPQRIK